MNRKLMTSLLVAFVLGVISLCTFTNAALGTTLLLTNVNTVGDGGDGQLLGFFELTESSGQLQVNNYILVAAVDGSALFEWSSNPNFPFPSSASASLNPLTNIIDILWSEVLPRGPNDVSHGVTLELAFVNTFNFSTSTFPLITSTNGTQGTSNWFEIHLDHDFGHFGNVVSGGLAISVPEPATLVLLGLGLAGLGFARRKQ